MNRHEPEHERWIEALALDERERIPERLRVSMSACAECARRVAGFEAARAAVESSASQMRADLAAAAQQTPGADELAKLRRWAGVNTRPAARAKLGWFVSLAAVLAVFAAGYYLARPTQQSPHSEHLGSARIGELRAEVSNGVVRLEWAAQSLGDEAHQVDVRYTDASGREHHFESAMLFAPRWQFEATKLAGAAGSWSWRVSLGSPGRVGREHSDWVTEPLPAN